MNGFWGQVIDLSGLDSYKIVYTQTSTVDPESYIRLNPLVGAGRFERPTPCAQGIGACSRM